MTSIRHDAASDEPAAAVDGESTSPREGGADLQTVMVEMGRNEATERGDSFCSGSATGSRIREAGTGVLIAFASVVVAVLLAEVSLRLFAPVHYQRPHRRIPDDPSELIHQRSSTPGLDYELVPNVLRFAYGALISTNSYGMRSPEPSRDASGAVSRIVVLGDSFTFGLGVSNESSYPAVLQELVNGSPPRPSRYEVLNLGVSAYSTADEAAVLCYKGLPWNPALVVIGYVLNDPETEPEQPLQSDFRQPEWWQYYEVLRLVMMAKHEWDVWRLGGEDYFRYLHMRTGSKWRSVVKAFASIREMSAPRSIRTLVVIFPMVPPSEVRWEHYEYGDLHEQVSAEAIKNGFDVLDLRPVFKPYTPAELRVSPADAHPSAYAHKLAAHAIADKLRADHLLP